MDVITLVDVKKLIKAGEKEEEEAYVANFILYLPVWLNPSSCP